MLVYIHAITDLRLGYIHTKYFKNKQKIASLMAANHQARTVSISYQ